MAGLTLADLASMSVAERAGCELTTGAAAEILGISRRQVTRWCERGILPAVRGVALRSGREVHYDAGQRGNRRQDWRIPVTALLAKLLEELGQ